MTDLPDAIEAADDVDVIDTGVDPAYVDIAPELTQKAYSAITNAGWTVDGKALRKTDDDRRFQRVFLRKPDGDSDD